MKYINIIFTIVIISLLLITSYGCGSSISNTPEQAVKDFYQSLNDRDCKKNLSLRSSNSPYLSGTDYSGQLSACKAQLQNGLPYHSVKIDGVTIQGSKAEVIEELTIGNQPTDRVRVSLIVEDNEWKIDKVQVDNTPAI